MSEVQVPYEEDRESQAVLLLAASDSAGLPRSVVKTTFSGFLVPEEVVEAAAQAMAKTEKKTEPKESAPKGRSTGKSGGK